MTARNESTLAIDRRGVLGALVAFAVAAAGCADAPCHVPDAAPCEVAPDAAAGGDASGDARGDAFDGAPPRLRSLDLADDYDNVLAWRLVRGSLDPEEEVVFYWTGHIYAVVPEDPSRFATPGPPVFTRPLFRFEGFNVARFVEDPAGGLVMLSREASFYEDPTSGEILECWESTLAELPAPVRILHVWNDPVNFGVGPVAFVEHGERVTFWSDVFLAYRSPLAGEERFRPYSAGDVYQGAEMFGFFVSRRDLEDGFLDSVPVEISWTRVGQFLPWMQMADRPGHLVYSARGWKLEGGYADLPQHIRRYVEAEGMDRFAHAPEEVPAGYVPNGTSWRAFARELDGGEYEPYCD